MIILTILIIRVLLFRMILKPWLDFSDVRKKESLVNNNSYAATVIYALVINYIKSKNLKIPLNQAQLSNDRKIYERPLGSLAMERFPLPDDPEELRLLRI